jgi:hypothetical protein
VYFIFKSMEQGPSFRVTVPRFPTKDPNHRILAQQKSRFTHNYFYIRDEVLGPMIMRVATFFPFQTTITSTATATSSKSSIEPESAFARTTTPSSLLTMSPLYRRPQTN